MDGSFYIAATSLVVSILALVLMFVSFKKSDQLSNFEFATRLVVANESIATFSPSFPKALEYSTKIVNNGLKPTDILTGWISYSSKEGSKRVKHNILGETVIAPGKERQLQFSMTWN